MDPVVEAAAERDREKEVGVEVEVERAVEAVAHRVDPKDTLRPALRLLTK